MDVYHAIADPNRRKLLELVADRERTVKELVAYFDITIGAVSQHLKVLLDSGLVVRRKLGRFRYYRSQPHKLREVHEWTARYEKFWTTRLDNLGDFLDQQP